MESIEIKHRERIALGKIKRDREITQDLMRNEERENEMKFFYQLCL